MFSMRSLRDEMYETSRELTFDELRSMLEIINGLGLTVFMPALSDFNMPYREEIVSYLASEGWALKHWSVAVKSNGIYGYPVFEKNMDTKESL